MMWQDLVFLVGSLTSVMFLYPTLRDTASRVPRATSVPSMLIGAVYSMTFFTLGMTFSAVGSFAACTMWSLIAAFRAPDDGAITDGTPVPRVSEWRPRLTAQVQRVVEAALPHTTGDEEFDVAPNSD
ncbi:hypothetical protein [Halobacterium wangiae]|uniref:hypothetical protein n=1 Tax=Halobacterium wangiae TaxID=2902623 RepID=UPI001E2FE9ED|nr:hypothetical protein [Halobacterium wangiae]